MSLEPKKAKESGPTGATGPTGPKSEPKTKQPIYAVDARDQTPTAVATEPGNAITSAQ